MQQFSYKGVSSETKTLAVTNKVMQSKLKLHNSQQSQVNQAFYPNTCTAAAVPLVT